eukprot:gene25466-11125_t
MDRWTGADDDIRSDRRQANRMRQGIGKVAERGLGGFVAAGVDKTSKFEKVEIVASKKEQIIEKKKNEEVRPAPSTSSAAYPPPPTFVVRPLPPSFAAPPPPSASSSGPNVAPNSAASAEAAGAGPSDSDPDSLPSARCFLIDLNSAHGTFADGARVPPHAPRELRPGDEIRFGASTRTYMFSYVSNESERASSDVCGRAGSMQDPDGSAQASLPPPPVEGRILGKKWQPKRKCRCLRLYHQHQWRVESWARNGNPSGGSNLGQEMATQDNLADLSWPPDVAPHQDLKWTEAGNLKRQIDRK